ncbi:MAG: hypothetical protein JSU98_02750 [Gemmatimonadales bacterium]|jgi:hypothetical protein|nr:MAG: hypothetical protein JSU98_02750 [Gemmatimonadales bacterium]
MTHEGTRWITVASYAARYLLEIPKQTLEQAGIPVLVKGQEPGIWGPAFSGPTSQGLELQVPEVVADEARSILEDLGEYMPEGED